MSDDPDSTRRRVLLGAGTGLVAALAGCGGTGGGATDTATGTDAPTETATETETTEAETGTETTGESGGTASVRVAHVSPNAPNVDVYVDGSAVLEDVPFGAVSDYLSLPAGSRLVGITPAGSPNTTVYSGDIDVEAGRPYTVAAVGEVGQATGQTFRPLVLAGDGSDPGSDTARLRVVHASPDAPAVDVTVEASGDVLFDGVGYGESGSTEVPAGDYALQIRRDTEDGDVVATVDASLAGGETYTAFAAGYLTPDDEPADTPFEVIVAGDTDGA